MRLKLASSPWWVQGLFYGLFFGAAMTVFAHLRTGEWRGAVIGGVLGGAFFGVFMGRSMSRLHQRMLDGLGHFSAAERRAVVRASSRGGVPTDPGQREAARTLLQRRRDQMVETRRWSVAVFGFAIALDVFLALTQSWLWWFCAVVFLGLLLQAVTWPMRMDRRLRVLDAKSSSS